MPADPLHEIFATSLNVAPEYIHEDLAYRGIAQWDSISHMALVAEIERHYHVVLETQDVLDLSSVAKAREILKKLSVSP